MRIAHVAVVTPRRCGLYETTRELVVGLRKLGIDSRLVDPTKEKNKLYPDAAEDRGAPLADMDFARDADVLVNHSGLGELEATNLPVIHIAHGRPRSSFLTEVDGGPPVYSYAYNKDKDPRFKAVVSFWPEHLPYLEGMWHETDVYAIPAPVDLDHWAPGETTYDFAGQGGEINVVCTDPMRADVDAFEAVHAVMRWDRACKLHLFGTRPKRGWAALLKKAKDRDCLGVVVPWAADLRAVYRVADVCVTANRIATRSVREAMACGCPVARVNDPGQWSDELNGAIARNRADVRREAEGLFDMNETAASFNKILQRVVN